MGGSKARHFLSNHLGSHSHANFEIWKKICDVTTYQGNDGKLGLKRARVWEACDKMVDLLEQPHLDDHGIEALKQATCRFTEEMVEAWGETHITHYMVMLYILCPCSMFFILFADFFNFLCSIYCMHMGHTFSIDMAL